MNSDKLAEGCGAVLGWFIVWILSIVFGSLFTWLAVNSILVAHFNLFHEISLYPDAFLLTVAIRLLWPK